MLSIRDALDSVQRHPRESERLARALLDDPATEAHERAEALWVLGRAQHELDRVDEACVTLEHARREASAAGDDPLAAEIAVSEAICRLLGGDTAASLALLDGAEPHLAGGPLGRLEMQRGLVRLYLGELEVARDHFDRALPLLEDAGDELARCRLLANRGIVHVTLGELDRGERDFLECRELADRLEQGMIASGAAHNLGFLSGRRGDIPGALAWFDQARREYDDVGSPGRLVAALESDVCVVLLSAGLTQEAKAAAGRAHTASLRSGNRINLADSLLQLAWASLAEQTHEDAAATAREAARVFGETERWPLAALSEYVLLRATVAGDGADPTHSVRDAREILEQLERHGWVNEAFDVRLFIGRSALAAGDRALGDEMLRKVADVRGAGPWSMRVSGWLALALLRLADDDREGARRALLAGMRVVDAHQATLGATDLRAHATAHGTDLVDLGLQLARTGGSAGRVLDWAERAHARSLELPSIRPPSDGRLRRLLGELRAAHAADADAVAAGHHDAEARRTIARLEAEVRSVSRASTDGDRAVRESVRRRDLVAKFDEFVLVEQVRIGDELIAVVVHDGRIATYGLGRHDAVVDLQRQALAGLRRLAFGGSRQRSLEVARNGLFEIGADLERALLQPLDLPVGVPLVVVPTGALLSMPWSVLPSLRDRSVQVAPSAAAWTPTRGTTGVRRALLVAGPDLDHADEELERIRPHYADPMVLHSDESTTDRVMEAMDAADVVHIAASIASITRSVVDSSEWRTIGSA